MAPLTVDPKALSGAGVSVAAAGDGLASSLATLTGAINANTGNLPRNVPAGNVTAPLAYHAGTGRPSDQTTAANTLCALGAANGIQCAVVAQPGKHDWPFAARVFATALPWLAGALHTPGVPAPSLPVAARSAATLPAAGTPNVAGTSTEAAGR